MLPRCPCRCPVLPSGVVFVISASIAARRKLTLSSGDTTIADTYVHSILHGGTKREQRAGIKCTKHAGYLCVVEQWRECRCKSMDTSSCGVATQGLLLLTSWPMLQSDSSKSARTGTKSDRLLAWVKSALPSVPRDPQKIDVLPLRLCGNDAEGLDERDSPGRRY